MTGSRESLSSLLESTVVFAEYLLCAKFYAGNLMKRIVNQKQPATERVSVFNYKSFLMKWQSEYDKGKMTRK